MLRLEGAINQCERDRKIIADRSVVMERLVAVLGLKGIPSSRACCARSRASPTPT